MAEYGHSTQLLHWTFNSQADVDAARGAARERHAAAGARPPPQQQRALLSPAAEQGFLNIFLDTIIKKLCSKEQLNENLTQAKYATRLYWTAATLFKRFYLRHSLTAENPTLMSVVAIFAASKVEELPLTFELRGVRVDQLASLSKLPPDLIVDNEIRFLAGVDFEMVVHHPTRVLAGLLERLRAERASSAEQWEVLEKAALALLDRTLQTDACFLHSPARIAFGALLVAHDRLDPPAPYSRNELLAWTLPDGAGADAINAIIRVADELIDELARAQAANDLVAKKSRTPEMTQWVEWWRQEFEGAAGAKRTRE
jgi:hypothetical protein